MRPVTFSRQEFLTERWVYRAGEHVTFLAPTDGGKTQLKWQLLDVTATQEVPAIVCAMKPRDKTTAEWSKKLDYRTVRDWPPHWNPWRTKPKGFVVWPKHTFDPDIDDEDHEYIFRSVIMDCYKTGNRILDVDELLAAVDLHLQKYLRAGWTRGRSMGMGLWGGTQKPTDIPTYAYGQAQHLFLGNDPDKRSTDRFDEIGGFDSGQLKAWVRGLSEFQFLYVKRKGRKVCIVDKD
jgi:hypothetical protein